LLVIIKMIVELLLILKETLVSTKTK